MQTFTCSTSRLLGAPTMKMTMLVMFVSLHIIGRIIDESPTNILTLMYSVRTGTVINKRVEITRMGAKMGLCAKIVMDGKSVNTILMYIKLVNAKQKIAKISIARFTIHLRSNDKSWGNILNFSLDAEQQTSQRLSIHPYFTTKDLLNLLLLVSRSLHFRVLPKRHGQDSVDQ